MDLHDSNQKGHKFYLVNTVTEGEKKLKNGMEEKKTKQKNYDLANQRVVVMMMVKWDFSKSKKNKKMKKKEN